MSVRDFTKTNIRLKKVHERLCRDRIPGNWNAAKRRLWKLNEKRESLSKWIDQIWKDMYRAGYAFDKQKQFLPQFDELAKVEKMRESCVNSINRLEAKHGLDSDVLAVEFNRFNTGRLSQSF